MKKVLIISPRFPPVNAADMQRVRQSLPYFQKYNWEPVVLTVDEQFVEAYSMDPLLLLSFPENIEVHKVKALRSSITRKFGMGSLSMRSYFFIKKKGDELLASRHFDLVYFSTTAFQVMALGPGWKKKFGVPFIVDIQDPWRNDFYYNRSGKQQSLKLWLHHKLDSYLEKKILPQISGMISVSPGYRDLYLKRYPALSTKEIKVIPFGCATRDFIIAKEHILFCEKVKLSNNRINVVYIGRGGHDLQYAVEIIFDAVKKGFEEYPSLFEKLHLWFIGTSYATEGKGNKTIEPVAINKGIGSSITEITDRIPYFETLFLLLQADILCVPGSADSTYTASKIYPYLYSDKPLLAVFHEKSSVCEVVKQTSNAGLITFNENTDAEARKKLIDQCYDFLAAVLNRQILKSNINPDAFNAYTAEAMTKKQVEFFEKVISE